MTRSAKTLLAALSASALFTPAQASAELVADYGVGGSYYVSSPGSGTAGTEWKKGVFAASLAAFIQGNTTEGRARANAGLAYRLSSDMFYLYGLVELWQRKPLEFANPAAGSLNGRLDLTQVKEALWSPCWNDSPGTTDNHRLMYATAALFGATDPLTNQRAGQTTGTTQSSCSGYVNTLDALGARTWVSNFIDATVKNGFPESDSATYVAAYLAPLRLIADKLAAYPTPSGASPSNAALANRAAKAFDWLVANMAGEWTNGSYTATTGREYFPADGSVYRPAELGNYLRVLFGGRVRVGERTWEDAGGGVRKPLAAMSIPLALTGYRPPAEVLVAATDRSAPFVQRESTRMGTAAAPSRALRTRSVEPGVLELASSSDGPGGWGSLQGQNLTYHFDSAGTENRTLTIANPENFSAWTKNLLGGFKALGARPELQWLQDGRSAVAVLETAVGAPPLIRGNLGDDMLQASWAPGTYSNNPWHVFGVDDKLWVGVRSVAALSDEGSADPFNSLDDSWFFYARNPGDGRGSFVIVDVVPQAQMTRSAFAAELNRSTPPRVVCSGIAVAGCSMPSPNARPSVSYTNLAGRTLTVGFPDGSGPARRSVDGVPVDESTWPLLESPWAEQSAGSDVLRISAVTGGASTTQVTEYATYTTNSASQTMVNASGRLEAWSGSAPSQVPTGWVLATWAGAPMYTRASNPHTGAYAGQVTLSSTGHGGFALNAANRPDVAQNRATVTAWLKTSSTSSGAGEGAYVWAQYAKADGTLVCSPVSSLPVTGTSTTWLSRSVTLPQKSCDPGVAKLAISVRLKGTGSLLVDDVDYALHP
jgi:hypothetical protein